LAALQMRARSAFTVIVPSIGAPELGWHGHWAPDIEEAAELCRFAAAQPHGLCFIQNPGLGDCRWTAGAGFLAAAAFFAPSDDYIGAVCAFDPQARPGAQLDDLRELELVAEIG
jgi:hypothetical protein